MKIGIEDHIDLLVEEGGVAKLQELAHDPDKATAKYARKGLHILRTRGVTAPTPLQPSEVHMVGNPVVVHASRSALAELVAAGRGEIPPVVIAAAVGGLIRRRRKKVEGPR